jgi:hypothetical protein
MLAALTTCGLRGEMGIHETNPPCLANMTPEIAYNTAFKENVSGKSLNILARPERFELPTPWFVGISPVRK